EPDAGWRRGATEIGEPLVYVRDDGLALGEQRLAREVAARKVFGERELGRIDASHLRPVRDPRTCLLRARDEPPAEPARAAAAPTPQTRMTRQAREGRVDVVERLERHRLRHRHAVGVEELGEGILVLAQVDRRE